MTEPPRPPGEGHPSDPTEPFNQYPPPAYNPPPSSGAGGYPPPSSGAGGYTPPPSSGAGGFTPPPSSGAGGFPPPPSSGGPYGQQQPFGQQPYGQPYGQPGYPPAGGGSNEDRTWILVAHFGGAAGAFITGGVAGWIAPLVAMLSRGNQSPAVRAEAVKALNFQLLWTVIAVVGYILTCIVIGFVVAVAAWLIATIIGVIAG